MNYAWAYKVNNEQIPYTAATAAIVSCCCVQTFILARHNQCEIHFCRIWNIDSLFHLQSIIKFAAKKDKEEGKKREKIGAAAWKCCTIHLHIFSNWIPVDGCRQNRANFHDEKRNWVFCGFFLFAALTNTDIFFAISKWCDAINNAFEYWNEEKPKWRRRGGWGFVSVLKLSWKRVIYAMQTDSYVEIFDVFSIHNH